MYSITGSHLGVGLAQLCYSNFNLCGADFSRRYKNDFHILSLLDAEIVQVIEIIPVG